MFPCHGVPYHLGLRMIRSGCVFAIKTRSLSAHTVSWAVYVLGRRGRMFHPLSKKIYSLISSTSLLLPFDFRQKKKGEKEEGRKRAKGGERDSPPTSKSGGKHFRGPTILPPPRGDHTLPLSSSLAGSPPLPCLCSAPRLRRSSGCLAPIHKSRKHKKM